MSINLVVGQTYKLKFSKQFCHALGDDGVKNFSKNMNSDDILEAVFIGPLSIKNGLRNIFYCDTKRNRRYIMFGADKVDYIVE